MASTSLEKENVTRPRSFLVVDLAPRETMVSARVKRWIDAYGYSRLARSLNVSRRQVHLWTHATNPDSPKIDTVHKIMGLSAIEKHSIGPLKESDFFGRVKVLQHKDVDYSDTHIYAPRFQPMRRPI